MHQKNASLIWQTPVYLPYLQPAINDDIIKNAELKIGYKLPGEYLNLLQIQNGGYIRYALPDSPHGEISGIGPYYPSITNFEWLLEYQGTVSFELKGLIPFDGDGHWNICFDYRRNKLQPKITYIDTETDYEEYIADNFNDYLDLLVLNTNGEYVINANETLENVVKNISILTGITFQEPDTFAHGYPVYRGYFNDAWFWIKPNKVSKGFIRPGENRYEELKYLMEIPALMHPELSESDFLISSSKESEMKRFLIHFQTNILV